MHVLSGVVMMLALPDAQTIVESNCPLFSVDSGATCDACHEPVWMKSRLITIEAEALNRNYSSAT
jgi:hypothetical protein